MTNPAPAAGQPRSVKSSLERALDTERAYFTLGAVVERLTGAELVWTPDFVHAPAAAVVYDVDPDLAAQCTVQWVTQIEDRLLSLDIQLSRIYLKSEHAGIGALLSGAGYVCREEVFFADNLPDPARLLTFRSVRTDEDWACKLRFHEEVPESPDGHANPVADLVALERHKCAHGMEAFLAEIDGVTVGAIGAIWGEGMVRIKNVLVHHGHRRRSVATTMLSHIAALGRARGIREQCLVALSEGEGLKLYRTLGMQPVGSQFEWSKPL
jgi:ribosomal protein S18 acetylase RimI-like enzyme